jgi:hypothetical protein
MAKNSVKEWDATASNNTDVGGIAIQGTSNVSNFDDALRTVMAQIKSGVDYKMVYVAKGANYTALLADNNTFFRFTAAATLSLDAAATLGANWHCWVVADGGDVIIDPNGAELVDGAATITITNGYSALLICTGTEFRTNREWATVSAINTALGLLGPKFTTSQSATGTAVDFVVPSTAKLITVMLNVVSLSGTDDILVQIGPTGGVETTGYSSGSGNASSSNAGFVVRLSNAARAAIGHMTITNLSGSLWVSSHNVHIDTIVDVNGGGSKTITGSLTKLRVTVSGANTFDGGTINVMYE